MRAMSAPEKPQGVVSESNKRATSSFFATLVAVLWSFFGVRRSDHHEQDMQNLNPVHVIAVGILAAGVFVLTLVGIVKWVVAG